MPTFCRHNRLISNCPICAREQDVALRPVVTGGTASSAASVSTPRRPADAGPARARATATRASSGRSGVTVRRMTRGTEDGYRSDLVPGLRSTVDAERLAGEIAWATARLATLSWAPPGLFGELVDPAIDIEERTWLAFLIAYLGPVETGEPFAEIQQRRVPWASGELGDLQGAQGGPRSSLEAGRAVRTLTAYRAWATRSGSQAAGLAGDPGWTPERRFARAYERIGLPGLARAARYDLLVTLGQTGLYELRAGTLALGGSDPVTIAAKRVLGIGDPILLERRAMALAQACEVPLQALDVALFNWERGSRATLGMGPELEPDPAVGAAVSSALGL